mmetsp:Transcript_4892/g.6337  ORF Transcript_4892/g.6337 Transcript_4892/m.6337 type:complete len:134 (-) Transcript_4892:291-692(-)
MEWIMDGEVCNYYYANSLQYIMVNLFYCTNAHLDHCCCKHNLHVFIKHFSFLFTCFLGYIKHANKLKSFLLEQPFASQIEIQYLCDKGITGNFEVSIVETKELIYSRQRSGGFCNTPSSQNEVAVLIEDALLE